MPMANIVDYLAWRGDLSLRERPFNDVDNLILSTFAYLDLTGIVDGPGGGSLTLSDACERALELAGGDISKLVRSLAKLDPTLLHKLALSRRFGSMRLHDYVDAFDAERALQFAAVQVDVDDDHTYVAFRGTDSTLVGWREDFMLTFTTTEAQRRAAAYLEGAAGRARERGRKLYVGGHSKGGNLALYGALACPIQHLPMISRVWSNDGPGIAPEVMDTSPARLLGERYVRLVPSYDLVGILLEREDDPRTVVASSSTGMRAHDPFTWQVTPFGMLEVPEREAESLAVQSAINAWLAGVPLDQRATVVDQLFDALGAGGARTLDEVISTYKGANAVLAAIDGMDESTKELVGKLIGGIVASTVGAATSTFHDAAASAFSAARDAVNNLFADRPLSPLAALGDEGDPGGQG